MEEYLVKLNKCNRQYITKLNTGNNQLPIISGRHRHINREEWYCTKCNDRQTGDEYHVLLQCQNQDDVQLRNTYLPEYYILRPNNFQFAELMQRKNVKLLSNLAQFVKALLGLFR